MPKNYRNEIEAAFEEWEEIGEEEFIAQIKPIGGGTFANPRSLWVRSSPRFEFKKYNTKAISTRAKDRHFDGTWGRGGSCTFLHNSGYVIVNKSGEPVTISERDRSIPSGFDYLLSGEERIIAVAISYYIEPARKARKSEVVIEDQKLADDIGPSVNMMEVGKVLESAIFSGEASIKFIGKRSNSDGSNVFRYVFKTDLDTDGKLQTQFGWDGKTITSMSIEEVRQKVSEHLAGLIKNRESQSGKVNKRINPIRHAPSKKALEKIIYGLLEKQNDKCMLCNGILKIDSENSLLQPSVDRIDSNNDSYVESNIWVTHLGCNYAKNQFSVDEFHEWLTVTRENYRSKSVEEE